jgi:hypothetical protein
MQVEASDGSTLQNKVVEMELEKDAQE